MAARRVRRTLFVLCALSANSACQYPATGVLFVLGSDAPPERELHVEARVWRAGEPEPVTSTAFSQTGLTNEGEDLFTVVPRGTPRTQTVQVKLQATLAATTNEPTQVLRRTMRFSFAANTTLYQRVFLAMACLNRSTDCQRNTTTCTVQDACEERGQTCGDNGECVSVDVMPQPIPDGGVGRDAGARRDATVRDASSDAVAMDVRADAPIDTMPDGIADATLDGAAVTDAAMDAGVDSASDARLDVAADARADTALDVRSDAATDVAADSRDAAPDSSDAGDGGIAPIGVAGALIAADGAHTCAATSPGRRIYCWGIGGAGRSALGTTASVGAPTLALVTDVHVAMSGGWSHGCFLTRNAMSQQRVTCFGTSASGECGVTAPSVVTGNTIAGTSWSLVATGMNFSCAADSIGDVYCWGLNSVGQFGNGATSATAQPVAQRAMRPWPMGATITHLDAGGSRVCARTSGSQIYCWGASWGASPTLVMLADARSVDVGDAHACAVTGANALYCWGDNSSGQFGNGTTMSSAAPVLVTLPALTQQVSTSGATTCVVSTTNVLRCWGFNGYGGVGNGVMGGNVLSPYTVAVPVASAAVAVGGAHTCARGTAGELFCWGTNSSGQLGVGTVGGMFLTPQRVQGS